MLKHALAHGRTARRLAAAGTLAVLSTAALVLVQGCSQQPTSAPGGATAATQPAAKPDATVAKADPAQPAAAKAAPAPQPGLATARDQATKAALEAGDAHAGHDHAAGDHAGHDHAKPDATKSGAAPLPALKTPEQIKAENAKAIDAKAAAAKTGDPMTDTDPNSKARITYEFGSDTHNFGKVMQGDVLNHKFTMSSSGEEDLIIKQAKPTCGCTVAQIMAEDAEGQMVAYQYGKALPPGRKIEISATLHTQNKRGHAGSKINMFTNDPRGQTILSLEADVDPYFAVNPPSINFQQLSQKDTATDKLTVTTTKAERVKLTAVLDNLPQGLKVELKPLDEDAEGKATRWDLVATAGPGLVEGSLAYSVQLKSDKPIPGGEKLPNGQMPSYEVQATIMARVTGAVSYNPQFVSLGLIRPGQTLSRSVRITSHDADFKLTSPEIAIQGRESAEWEYARNFTAVLRPVANENAVDVEVTLTGMPDSLSGSFSGVLLVKVGHPDKPEIKIPITGVCRGSGATPVAAPVTSAQPK